MRRRIFLQSLAATAASVPLSGCNFLRDHDSLRFTATLEIRTPSGTKTGSSVLEADMTGGLPGMGTMDNGKYFVRGQAPYVDLGFGKFLFLSLIAEGGFLGVRTLFTRWLAQALTDSSGTNWRETFPMARREKPTGPVDFSKNPHPPMMVTFDNARKPASVRRANHALLSSTFGPGYFLMALRFDVGDQSMPLTKGFEERFPQFFSIPGNGQFVKPQNGVRREPHQRLTGRHFVHR